MHVYSALDEPQIQTPRSRIIEQDMGGLRHRTASLGSFSVDTASDGGGGGGSTHVRAGCDRGKMSLVQVGLPVIAIGIALLLGLSSAHPCGAQSH